MATSIDDLLRALINAAYEAPPHPHSRADAGTAVAHLGRALIGLKSAGVSADIGDERERRVAALGALCIGLGARAPVTNGSLTTLAGVAADATVLLHEETTIDGRWAISIRFTLAIDALAGVVTRGMTSTPAHEWIAEIRTLATKIGRDAARRPPQRGHTTTLDRPIPAPHAAHAGSAAAILDSTAAIVDATRPAADGLPISAIVAITLACQTLCDTAGRLLGEDRTDTPGAHAGRAWEAVRVALRPFNDGSRRPQTDAPPAVLAAHRLHTQLGTLPADPRGIAPDLRAALTTATQHLPAISLRLTASVASWESNSTVFAYARDLPVREERLSQHFAGYRNEGLVHVDRFDLMPVTDALRHARLLSTALAADLPAAHIPASAEIRHRPERSPDAATRTSGPRAEDVMRRIGPAADRLTAVNRAFRDELHTPARLAAAKEAAYRQLQKSPSGPRRGR